MSGPRTVVYFYLDTRPANGLLIYERCNKYWHSSPNDLYGVKMCHVRAAGTKDVRGCSFVDVIEQLQSNLFFSFNKEDLAIRAPLI